MRSACCQSRSGHTNSPTAGLTRFSNPVIAHGLHPQAYAAVWQFISSLVLINVLLACFNLLPIPPLDGSRIVDALMPDSVRPLWASFSALGPLLLVAVIVLPSLLGVSLLFWPLHWAGDLLQWVTGG